MKKTISLILAAVMMVSVILIMPQTVSADDNAPLMIANCDSYIGWSGHTDGGDQENTVLDPYNKTQGAGSIGATITSPTTYGGLWYYPATPLDLTGQQYIEFDFYSDRDCLPQLLFTLYSGSEERSYVRNYLDIKRGWNHFKTPAFGVMAEEHRNYWDSMAGFDLTSIYRIRIIFSSLATADVDGGLYCVTGMTFRFDNICATKDSTPTQAQMAADKEMLSNCDTSAGWAIEGSYNSSIGLSDSVDKTEGAASLELKTAGEHLAAYLYPGAKDLSRYWSGRSGYIELDLWSSHDMTGHFSVHMMSTLASGWDGINYDKADYPIQAGWNKIYVPLSEFNTFGHLPTDISSIEFIRFQIYGSNVTGYSIKLDNVRATYGYDDRTTLKTLTLDGGNVLDRPLDQSVNDYTVDVLAGGENITVSEAIADDCRAAVVITNNGTPTVTVTVTPYFGGAPRVYTISSNVVDTKQRRFLDSFENVNNIYAVNERGTYLTGLDSTNSTQGQSSAAFSVTGVPEYSGGYGAFWLIDTFASVSIIRYTDVEFDIWCSDAMPTAKISFNLVSDPNYQDGYNKEFNQSLVAGWNHVKVPMSAFDRILGNADFADIRRVRIIVQQEDLLDFTVKVDNIRATRDNVDDSALLSALSVAGQSFKEGAFDPYVTKYSIDATPALTQINISATAGANSTVLSGTGTQSVVNGGENEYIVSVKNAFGDIRNYYIYVNIYADNPHMLNDCDTGLNIAAETHSDVKTRFDGIDTVFSTQGQASVKLSTETNAMMCFINDLHGINAKAYKYVEFDIWRDLDAPVTNLLQFDLITNPGIGTGYGVYFGAYTFNNGWNHIKVPISDFGPDPDPISAGSTLTNITRMRIIVADNVTNLPFSMKLDNIRFTPGESDVATLSGLSVAGVPLNETFDPYRTEYTINSDALISTLTVNATATEAGNGATVSVTFEPVHKNKAFVTVTGKYGGTRTYTIVNASTIIPSKPLFNGETNNIVGEPFTNDPSNKPTMVLGVDTDNRTEGRGSAAIKSAGDSIVTYINLSPAADVTGYDYVEFDVWSNAAYTGNMFFNFAASDQHQTGSDWQSNGYHLNAGWNKIKIPVNEFVTSIDLTSIGRIRFIYSGTGVNGIELKLDNVRLTMGNDDGALLSSLTLGGGLALLETFAPEKAEYSIDLAKGIDSVDIIAVPQISGSTITVDGNRNLVKGENLITITVTSVYNVTAVYTITANVDIYIKVDGIKDDKYTDDKSVEVVNSYRADGITPGPNPSNASLKVWYAYDADYLYFYAEATQDSINPLKVTDYSPADTLYGNLADHIEFWINPDPSFDGQEMIDSILSPDMMDVSPRFFPADLNIGTMGHESKAALINSKTAKVFVISDTQYGVEFKYPRDKSETSFKFTATLYVSNAVDVDGTPTPTSGQGYYLIAMADAWWRFHRLQQEVLFDDIVISNPETASYISSTNPDVIFLNDTFVINREMTIAELIDSISVENGFTVKFFGKDGKEITDYEKSAYSVFEIKVYFGGTVKQVLVNASPKNNSTNPDVPVTGVGGMIGISVVTMSSMMVLALAFKKRRRKTQ